VLKEGPVSILSLAAEKAGAQSTIDLWNGIAANETFPPDVESAFYILELTKVIPEAANVRVVEAEMIRALNILASCWSFSGGSYMVLHTAHSEQTPRYASNADEVEALLLSRMGLKQVSKTATFAICTGATYHVPPLQWAARIGQYLLEDGPTRKLVEYFHKGWIEYFALNRTERSDWFVNLYKARDTLKAIYGSEDEAKAGLSIAKADWSSFGGVLNNNDLRHADIEDRSPSLPREGVSQVFDLARGWIKSHLTARGLSVF